jgi:outer membrane protein OmpA-like peptidoglycan-associated protein
MRVKTIGWVVGSLGLLVGAGTAWGNEEGDTASGTSSTSSDMATRSAGMAECKDAGVTVAFKTGSAELDQNARGALDGVATWMKADDKRNMHLEGFADTTGDSEANLVLSAKRAEAVKNYLIEHGVNSSNLITVGRGEEADHLPANGRAVTFLACQPSKPASTVAENETPAPVPEAVPPAPEPAPVEAVPPPPPAPVEVIPPPPAPRHFGSTVGFALMAGGNFQDYTNSTMRAATQGAGGWDARLVAGLNSIIGVEASYIGSAQQFQGLGVTNNTPLLVSNGVEGTARLNIPLHVGYHLIEPYGFAGVGYAHYTISNFNNNAQALSSFSSSDDVMTVPVGGGLAYAFKGFIADARAGWTATYYQNLLNGFSGSSTLDHWQVGGNVGFRF